MVATNDFFLKTVLSIAFITSKNTRRASAINVVFYFAAKALC
jgi:hypothetical protein